MSCAAVSSSPPVAASIIFAVGNWFRAGAQTGACTVCHRELFGLTMRRVAVAHSKGPARWREAFGMAMDRIAGRFARCEPCLRARRLMLGRP